MVEDLQPKNRVAIIEARPANGWSYQRIADEKNVSTDFVEIVFNRLCAINEENFELIKAYDRALRREERSGFGALGGGEDLVPHPGGEGLTGSQGCLFDESQFVGAEMHAADLATAGVALGSPGREGHKSQSSGTTPNTSRQRLDNLFVQSRFGSIRTTPHEVLL